MKSLRKQKQYKGWSIYSVLARIWRGVEYIKDETIWLVYLPEQGPDTMDSPEFECDSLQECLDNIDSY